jgi:adenosylcobinamide kinase/adenosylcobinamide-phosphate guanylyltransferase
MKKSIFILGGARSGKSSYAVDLAKKSRKRTAFIATCTSFDSEMKKRIKAHKKSRPRQWKVIEEGKHIDSVLIKLGNKYEVILIDCLGLWISNLLAEKLADKQIEKEIAKLIKSISKRKDVTILVSNEVGAGIVPDNPLARRFRDLLGLANQMMAREADKVIFMQSGIPMIIKGEGKCRS